MPHRRNHSDFDLLLSVFDDLHLWILIKRNPNQLLINLGEQMNLHSTSAGKRFLKPALALAISAALLGGCGSGNSSTATSTTTASTTTTTLAAVKAATPIQHVVVIFQENVSFDHYFGTYPKASNPAGEPAFTAAAGTPTVNICPHRSMSRRVSLRFPASIC